MHVAHTFDDLVALERQAEEERARLAGLTGDEYAAQWVTWREASEAAQAAITEHAVAENASRVDVEMAVKRAVRHTDEDPVE